MTTEHFERALGLAQINQMVETDLDRDRLNLARQAGPPQETTLFTDGIRPARSFAIILIVHLAVIVLWQVLVDAFQVPKFILPSPLATLATLGSAKYAWLSNLAVTAVEILGGFALAPWSASRWR